MSEEITVSICEKQDNVVVSYARKVTVSLGSALRVVGYAKFEPST
jgi:hypothetical protein